MQRQIDEETTAIEKIGCYSPWEEGSTPHRGKPAPHLHQWGSTVVAPEAECEEVEDQSLQWGFCRKE